MAQLCIYVDQVTIKKIEKAAKKEHKAVSEWCRLKLNEVLEMKDQHMDLLRSLYGSLKDSDIARPEQPILTQDSTREIL